MTRFRFGVQINLHLDKENAESLAAFAEREKTTKTQAARRILEQFLAAQAKKDAA